MATKNTAKQQINKDSKELKPKAKNEKRAEKQVPEKGRRSYLVYAVVLIVVALIAVSIYYVFANTVAVPFSSFKTNFLAAPRVGVVSTFSNLSQLPSEISCYSQIIQYIAHNRNSKTIDFFQIDQRNASCTYAAGLGYPINTSQQTAGKCLAVANSEPSVFLNFSNANSTTVTLLHLYVSGNAQYLAKCPIAPDLG
ncbi:MAG: hypothetical protein KGH65_05750 [Candidatus Micrarchaeota archaeon]|nr:hypothetical protein [Candidatus Micrarchaeota archaeon]